MPKVNWGIDDDVIDSFDRDAQFKPYTGALPPTNMVYCFSIKTLKHVAGANGKWPQLRAGLSLEPRNQEEAKYEGYFIMRFMTIAPPTADKKGTGFQYIPFLDALGVSATDFTQRTITDEDGNVKRIGKWKNEGNTLILCRLENGADQNGAYRVDAGWVGDASEVIFEEYDSEVTEDGEFDDDELYDDEDDA